MSNSRIGRITALAAALLMAAGGAVPAVAAKPDGLKSFAGSWSGGGTVRMSNGTTQKIKCRGSVSAGGSSARQQITCASTNLRLSISSNISVSGSSLRGTLRESVQGFTAGLSGSTTGNGFHVSLSGRNTSASGSISGSARSMSISISVTGKTIASVQVSLSKR